MRSVLVAILVSTTALLAGCADKGGHEHETYDCPDGTEIHLDEIPGHDNATFNPLAHCGGRSGTGTNTTGAAPNVLPTLVLSVTDDGGNETLVAMLGTNLTFSADGSTDSDGSITGIAVSVTDSNTTRTASLYDAASKSFKPATFKFDRPGIVNVTIAMVDDRAGFAVNQSHVYVNHPQTVGTGVMIQSSAPGVVASDDCTGAEGSVPGGAVGGTVVDSNYFKSVSFAVVANATFIEATSTGGDLIMTICSPDGTALGEQAEGSATTAPGTPLPPAPGTTSYSVGVYANAPPAQEAEMLVIVHYEPQTAAEAPAEG